MNIKKHAAANFHSDSRCSCMRMYLFIRILDSLSLPINLHDVSFAFPPRVSSLISLINSTMHIFVFESDANSRHRMKNVTCHSRNIAENLEKQFWREARFCQRMQLDVIAQRMH